MKVAILESIVMPAGHEVEFDRILVEELAKLGHQPCFFVPENFPFKLDYKVPVHYLSGGEAISYAGANKFKKIWLSWQRELRRRKWFNSAQVLAAKGTCEQIIIPTGTFRYLRTLLNSNLKHSPIPVTFIFHGINPREQANFVKYAKLCEAYPNIRLKVITLRDDLSKFNLSNLQLVLPPVYTPRDLQVTPEFKLHTPLRLGIFGQYRREKNLEFFLEAFLQAKFAIPVELLVQGATARTEDKEDFERLIAKYQANSGLTFLHKNLIGRDWQQALLDVDVILMPYAAERYLYHWGAMLFTAIGFYKPILQSPELNPEVLENFNIGEAVQLDNIEIFSQQLERFVNEFPAKAAIYGQNLTAANEAYRQDKFVDSLLK